MTDIQMVGLDHSRASLQLREKFSFTNQLAQSAMRRAVEEYGVQGCVLLSTCNRTELWLHGVPEECDTAGLLCRLRGVKDADTGCLTVCSGPEAVRRLLRTAAGLESRVFGEDQIIAQVGRALALARECGAADSALECLFRTAATAAKRVKSAVRLSARDSSAASRAADVLKESCETLAGLRCLIIGSGEMGRLAARRLLDEGCRVTMTLRSYDGHAASLPLTGCAAVPYENRLAALHDADVVVSATASPHHTLMLEDAAPYLAGRRRWLVDLAVPRDLDPRLAELPDVTLYDIDSLGGVTRRDEAAVARACAILEKYAAEFEDWYAFRELVPVVRRTSRLAAGDIACRMEKAIRALDLPEEARAALSEQLLHTSNKVVEKLLFGLRDQAERPLWQPCLEGLEEAARRMPPEFAGQNVKPGPVEKEETA